MSDYIIVAETTPKELQDKVNHLLTEGFHLAGGVSVAFIHPTIAGKQAEGFWYAQALIKP